MKVCLLLVWRDCDQAAGRYKSKSGHVTITKVENLHTDTHVENFTDSKNATLSI